MDARSLALMANGWAFMRRLQGAVAKTQMASLCAAVGSVNFSTLQELRQNDDAGVAGRARALGRFSYTVAGLLVPKIESERVSSLRLPLCGRWPR